MNLLNLENEKIKTVTVNGFQFSIRYMSPLDRIRVTQQRMKYQDGNSVEALTQDEFIFLENVAMCDICTEKFPDNFKEYESCIKWDDISMINGLAHEIRTHTSDIEQKLKKNRPAERGAES
jgi:hypothetical protein